MTTWPPIWEAAFDFDKGGSPLAHQQSVEAEVRNTPALRALSVAEQRTLAEAIWIADWWASAALNALRDCPWQPLDRLRAAMPEGIKPGREEKAWRRYRALLDWYDACWVVRDAALKGEWADAINWALIAGNRSMLELAEIGRKSLATLPKRGTRKPLSPKLSERNALIVAEARDMLARNPHFSATNIARKICDRHSGDRGFPKPATIRKLVSRANLAMQGLHKPK